MPVTDLTAGAQVTSAGYVTTQYQVVSQNQRTYVTKYTKYIRPNRGQPVEFGGLGASTVDQATADANALISLNAVRRHRYGGAPGQPSGATVTWDQQDVSQTPFTVDVN